MHFASQSLQAATQPLGSDPIGKTAQRPSLSRRTRRPHRRPHHPPPPPTKEKKKRKAPKNIFNFSDRSTTSGQSQLQEHGVDFQTHPANDQCQLLFSFFPCHTFPKYNNNKINWRLIIYVYIYIYIFFFWLYNLLTLVLVVQFELYRLRFCVI